MQFGYARVSTREQNTDSPLDALRTARCERVICYRASGKLARRPEWDKPAARSNWLGQLFGGSAPCAPLP
ncbi:MAG: recombinase family protein [Actinomycetota bacterium]|nr:recombinase family protein [Actinomycetota bacterium]